MDGVFLISKKRFIHEFKKYPIGQDIYQVGNPVPKGHYLVTNSSSLDQCGKTGRGYRIQFRDNTSGKNIESIIEQLDRQSLYGVNDFLEVLNDDTWLSEVNSNTTRVLGQLYPETYSVYWTDKPKTIIGRLINKSKPYQILLTESVHIIPMGRNYHHGINN